jgi:hypothetical protein
VNPRRGCDTIVVCPARAAVVAVSICLYHAASQGVTDFTPEGLQKYLCEHPAGVVLYFDEMSHLWKIMGSRNGQDGGDVANMSLLLKCYDGVRIRPIDDVTAVYNASESERLKFCWMAPFTSARLKPRHASPHSKRQEAAHV